MRRATILFLLLLAGCPPLEPERFACTTEARSTFAITVVDSLTGASLAPTAIVAVVEGAFADTLMPPSAPNGPYSGSVYERPGVYTVTVTHDDYESWRMEDVEVGRDECHVITRSLTARLSPA